MRLQNSKNFDTFVNLAISGYIKLHISDDRPIGASKITIMEKTIS